MTPLTPQPMATPDLAGILGRPARARRSPESPSPVASDADANRSPASLESYRREQEKRREPAGATDHPNGPAPGDQRVPTGSEGLAPTPSESPSEVSAVREYQRQITVYLPRSLFEALAQAAVQRQQSRTALMLLAVNATHSRLAERLTSEPAAPGSLFDVPQVKVAPTEPNTQTSIRVTDQQLSVLEALAAQSRTNRSKVLAAALELYLD